jgi:uncharacterized membrane protein
VEQAHRDLAQVWHPDRFGDNPRLRTQAEDKIKEINAAYDLLRRRRSSSEAPPQRPAPSEHRSSPPSSPPTPPPPPPRGAWAGGVERPAEASSLFRVTSLVYALHGLSIVIGLVTAAAVITAFVLGWPSIIAVIINYVKRGEARGTYLESHFRWQIRTFWFGLLWFAIGGVVFVTLVGIPIALAIWLGAGLWATYRIVRGWLALRDRRPVP